MYVLVTSYVRHRTYDVEYDIVRPTYDIVLRSSDVRYLALRIMGPGPGPPAAAGQMPECRCEPEDRDRDNRRPS